MLAALIRPLIHALSSLLIRGIPAVWQLIFVLPLNFLKSVAAPGTLQFALVACWGIGFAYVGLLYIWQHSVQLPRNHPASIQRRFISCSLACSLAWLPLYIDLQHQQVQGSETVTLLAELGVHVPSWKLLLRSISCTLLHVSTLFACPIVYTLLQHRIIHSAKQWWHASWTAASSRNSAQLRQVLSTPFSEVYLQTWRDAVIAPLTEEFVFRACMAPLLIRAGCSTTTTIFVTPLFFGVAHLHHLRDLVLHQHWPLSHAALKVSVQFMYTSMFGWYATWLFLECGSLWPPVAAHMLCNVLGFPNFAAMAHQFGRLPLMLGTTLSIYAFTALLKPLHRSGWLLTST